MQTHKARKRNRERQSSVYAALQKSYETRLSAYEKDIIEIAADFVRDDGYVDVERMATALGLDAEDVGFTVRSIAYRSLWPYNVQKNGVPIQATQKIDREVLATASPIDLGDALDGSGEIDDLVLHPGMSPSGCSMAVPVNLMKTKHFVMFYRVEYAKLRSRQRSYLEEFRCPNSASFQRS